MVKKQREGINFLLSQFRMYCEMETDKEKVAFMDAIFLKQFFNKNPNLDVMPKLARLAYKSEVHAIEKSVSGYLGNCKSFLTPTNTGFESTLEDTLEDTLEQVQVQVQVQDQVKGKDKGQNDFLFFEKIDPNHPDVKQRFDKITECYPKQENKHIALKEWCNLTHDERKQFEVFISVYSEHLKREVTEYKWTKSLSKIIEGKMFLDDLGNYTKKKVVKKYLSPI